MVSDPSAKNHTEATGARTAGTMHGAAEAGLGGLHPSAPRTCADPSVQWVTHSSLQRPLAVIPAVQTTTHWFRRCVQMLRVSLKGRAGHHQGGTG